MSTLLWDVRSTLVELFTTATGLEHVHDGPRPRGAIPKEFVLVGSDGGETGLGEESFEDDATAEQVVSSLGNNWRDETGTVVCSAWAWAGNVNFSVSRTKAKTNADACFAAIRADRTLGGLLIAGGLAEVASVSTRDSQKDTGALSRVVFAVAYRSLITT